MIIVGRPPNFEQILAAFPDAGSPGVIFAFGAHIYNPTGNAIPPALIAHEAVHQQRQLHGCVAKWWKLYLSDHEFRYHEELLAHVAEYKVFAQMADRNQRARLLVSTAARLVAPLYNYVPPRSLNAAVWDLKQEIDR